MCSSHVSGHAGIFLIGLLINTKIMNRRTGNSIASGTEPDRTRAGTGVPFMRQCPRVSGARPSNTRRPPARLRP
ncbi:protein of unknown function [Paraburkholderia kururiensis]